MSEWREDRKYVLEALVQNREDHRELLSKLDKLVEAQWKLSAKVAGIAGGVGFLAAGLVHLVFH